MLQEDFDIPMSMKLERKVSTMCNLSEGVWSKAMQRGHEEGMQQGMIQGMQQGMLDSIRNLMDTMKLTAQQAMAALKVPEDEQPKYMELLK